MVNSIQLLFAAPGGTNEESLVQQFQVSDASVQPHTGSDSMHANSTREHEASSVTFLPRKLSESHFYLNNFQVGILS